jgi:hypothetical protein
MFEMVWMGRMTRSRTAKPNPSQAPATTISAVQRTLSL